MISHKGKTRTVGRFRCFIPHVLWMHCFICRRAVPIADWTKTPKKMQRLTRDRVSVFFLLKKWHFDLCFTGHWTGHLLKKISKDFSFGSEEKLREREIPFPVLTHKDREEHLVVESSVLRFVFLHQRHEAIKRSSRIILNRCQNGKMFFILDLHFHRGIGWRLSQQSGDHVEIHHFNFCLKLRFEFSRPPCVTYGNSEVPTPRYPRIFGNSCTRRRTAIFSLFPSSCLSVAQLMFDFLWFFVGTKRRLKFDLKKTFVGRCEDFFSICWRHLYIKNMYVYLFICNT